MIRRHAGAGALSLSALALLAAGLAAGCGNADGEGAHADGAHTVDGDAPGSAPGSDAPGDAVSLASLGADSADAAAGDDPSRSALDPLSISGEIIRDHNLVSGDCFDRVEGLIEDRKVVITSRIDCDDPHVYEVFHTFELDVPHPAMHPGDTKMRDYARKLCYEHFFDFIGEIYELSVYEIGVFTPDRTNFEHEVARYRRVHCWLHRKDRARMAASARGSGI